MEVAPLPLPSAPEASPPLPSTPRNTSRSRLVLIIVSMFAAYVAHDYVQELIFTYASFKFGWYMSLVEVSVITLASFLQARCGSQPTPIAPSLTELKCSFLLAAFIAVTLGTGTASIQHVSFPVKVVMKSSKLLPTMLIRSLFMNAKYSLAQAAAAIGVCIGCAMFALADASSSASSHASATGIALLSIAVVADACVANTQETVMSRYRIPTARMVLYSNALGAVMLLFTCIANGELAAANAAIARQPVILALVLAMAACGCAGLPLYLLIVSEYSSAIAVASTTLRKAVTMALSILWFGHAFTLNHVAALAVLGLSVHVADRTSGRS